MAFAVTGINKAIDTAAAKVFGEDLVKVANIAGAAFAVFNKGFDIGIGGGSTTVSGAVTDTAKSAVDYTNSMDKASDAYSATNTNVVDKINAGGMPAAETPLPATASPPAAVPESPVAIPKLADAVPKTAAPVAQTPTISRGNGLTASNANGPGMQPAPTNATNPYSLDYKPNASSSIASAPAPSTSFMDHLQNMATSPQVLAGVVQGAAGAYQGSANRAQQQAMQQAEIDKRDALAKVGNAGWKQTFRTPA